MPLVETTTVKDGETVVKELERKLYTLAELRDGKHIEDEPDDIIESQVGRGYENALEWLAQGQFEDTWWSEAVLDGDAVELFKAVGITVPQKTETVHVKENGKFTYDEHNKAIKKVVTRDDTIWDGWDIDRGEFLLNPRARVDEQAFLFALQWYLAGKDIRDLPELRWGQPTPPRPLAAGVRQQRKFDRRSKDARIIREQGLVIHQSDYYRANTDEFDLDYHYDGLSDQTKEDANELLSGLCHEVLSLLRDEQEYRESEEYLLEEAEANDYRFTKYGGIA